MCGPRQGTPAAFPNDHFRDTKASLLYGRHGSFLPGPGLSHNLRFTRRLYRPVLEVGRRTTALNVVGKVERGAISC